MTLPKLKDGVRFVNDSFKSVAEVYILAEAKQAIDGYTGEYDTVAFSNGTDYKLIQDKDNNLEG